MANVGFAPARSLPADAPIERWNRWTRVLFRFSFVYLILYCWPDTGRSSLLDAIPGYNLSVEDSTPLLSRILEAPWHSAASWTAVRLLRVRSEVAQFRVTGSGDRTVDYVTVACFAAIAMFVTAIWSVLDRRRPNYRVLYGWLRWLVRYTLAFAMLSYGFAKVFPSQFPPPFLYKLTETYGESSPMGLLWTFMGASPAYSRFCGLAEVAAGMLLLFRRTTVAGAMLAAAAMVNVAMLNFCYDVGVKLYSTHLALMAIFLVIPDLGALWSFFVLRQPARPVDVWPPNFERRWLRASATLLQALVIASILFNNYLQAHNFKTEFPKLFGRPGPVYGIWQTDRFQVEGGAANDGTNWWQLAVDSEKAMRVRRLNGERIAYQCKYDERSHSVTLTSPLTKQRADLTYSQPDSGHLTLQGTLDSKHITGEFHFVDPSKLLLNSRSFHWITEVPFNR